MIKRVRIANYKSFSDLSIHLRPLSVIFGQTPLGKVTCSMLSIFFRALSVKRT